VSVGVVDRFPLLDARSGKDGKHMVVGKGQPGVLVTTVHHHGCVGEYCGQSVASIRRTDLEAVCVKDPTEILDHVLVCFLQFKLLNHWHNLILHHFRLLHLFSFFKMTLKAKYCFVLFDV